MKKIWFVKSNKTGEVFGPYTKEAVQYYIRQGKINNNDYRIFSDETNTIHELSTKVPRIQNALTKNLGEYQVIKDSHEEEKKIVFENEATKFQATSTAVEAQPYMSNGVQNLGKYKIIKELGRGGMGIVFEAEDTQLKRKCAIKVLLPEFKFNTSATQRFQSEARAVAKIEHRNIIKVHEICETPQYFFVMPFIDGVPLDQYMFDKNLDEKLKIFNQICEAISFAHDNNILHRDLKPDNILVNKDGVPIIVDFGIAKHVGESDGLTKTGDIFGTPKYMAPETARGQKTDHRGDIYSLGVILYEMLTGVVPFTGDNPIELLFHLTTTKPIPPSRLNLSIPKDGDLEVVCLRALEKIPDKRISSAKFLQEEIENIIHKRPIKLKPPTKGQRFLQKCKENKELVVFVTVLLFSSVWAFYVLYEAYNEAASERNKATQKAETVKQDAIKTVVASQLKTIESTFEALDAGVYAPDIFADYDKIKRCYQYLNEIAKHSSKNISKEYQRLDMYLKYRVLANFPQIIEKDLPRNDKTDKYFDPIISPGNKYIARFYEENNTSVLYIWPTTSDIFTKKNALLQVKGIHYKTRVIFSRDGVYLIYFEGYRLNIYHLLKRKVIFSFDNANMEHVVFSDNGRYLAFASHTPAKINGKNTENFCHILSLPSLELHKKFPVKELGHMRISPKATWFVFHDEKEGTFFSFNLLTNTLENYKEQLSYLQMQRPCKSIFSKEDILIIFTSISVQVLDIKNKKLAPSPILSMPPSEISATTALSDSLVAIGRKNGGLLKIRQNKDQTLFVQDLPSYSEQGISGLFYAPVSFLAISRFNSIELWDIYTTRMIASLRQKNQIVQANLVSSTNNAKVIFVTKNKYHEYTYQFEKRPAPIVISEVFEKIKSVAKDVNPGRQAVVDKELLLYQSPIGFLAWNKNEFVYKRYWDQARHEQYNSRTKELFVLFRDKNIEVFNCKTAERVRKYNFGKLKKQRFVYFNFSPDKQHILLSVLSNLNQEKRLLKQNMKTKAFEVIGKTDMETVLLDHLPNGDILVVCGNHKRTHNRTVHIFTKNKQRIDILKEKPFGFITCITTSKKFFAVGEHDGQITLWENDTKEKYHSLKVFGSIRKLSFSPNEKYLAVFTFDSIFVYDISNIKNFSQGFEIYRGYHKVSSVVFSPDWSKAYIADGVANTLIFDQKHLLDRDALYKRILQCDKAMENKTNDPEHDLLDYVKTLDKHMDSKQNFYD